MVYIHIWHEMIQPDTTGIFCFANQKSDPVDTGHRSEEGEADSDVDGDDSDKEAAASPRTGRDFNPSDSSDKPNGWLRKASEDSSHSKHSPKQTGGSPDATLADNDGSENHDSRDQTTTVHKDDSDAVDGMWVAVFSRSRYNGVVRLFCSRHPCQVTGISGRYYWFMVLRYAQSCGLQQSSEIMWRVFTLQTFRVMVLFHILS